MNGITERAGLLAECMEDINETLIEMTAVFRAKRQVMARADMAALDDLLAREEAVAQRLFDAESRREVLTAEMASALGVKSERLVDILPALPQGAAEVLSEAGHDLRDTLSALVREARIVADICRAAMEHYDRLIRIVTGAGIMGTYTPKGISASGARRNILDQAY